MTVILKYFYSNKYFKNKYNYYECGFRSLTNIQIKYTINYILVILFLVIYDGEFLLLVPFALNINDSDFYSFLLIIFFIFWLIITLLIDNIYNTLEWQI